MKIKKKLIPILAAGCIISMTGVPILSWAGSQADNPIVSRSVGNDFIPDEDIVWNPYYYEEDEGEQRDTVATGSDAALALKATSSDAEMATASNAILATPSNLAEKLMFDESEILTDVLNFYDDCEAEHAGAKLEDGAPDGSLYYKKDTSDLCSIEYSTSDISNFCVWEMDIRFDSDGAGFTPKNKSGTGGNLATCVRRKDEGGKSYLKIQKSSSGYDSLTEINPDSWYRLALRGSYANDVANIDLYLQEYGADGELVGEVEKFENVNRRNNCNVRRLVLQGGTSVDNVHVYAVAPGRIDLTAAGNVSEVYSNSTVQYTPTIYTALDEKMPSSATAVNYAVYRSDGEQVILEAEINENGLLKILGSTVQQDFLIRAYSKLLPTVYGEKALHVKAVGPVVIKKIGFNADYTKLVCLRVDVNQIYDTGIVFIVGIYDKDGLMKASYAQTLEADSMGTGSEVKININGELPDDFDRTTDMIKVFTWQK